MRRLKRISWIAAVIAIGLMVTFSGSASRSISAAVDQATEAATDSATEAGLGSYPPAHTVTIPAADGLQIVALYYPSMFSGRQAPGALLLHQLDGSKAQMLPMVPSLQAEGYAILVPDIRGFGETGGAINWKKAEADIATELKWMRDEPSIDGDTIAIVGASIGANLAIRGCANDAKCKAVVALSPGIEYFLVHTDDAIQKMRNKAALLVAGQQDLPSADAVRKLLALSPGNVMGRLYASYKHGIEFFDTPDGIPMIMQWLNTYN